MLQITSNILFWRSHKKWLFLTSICAQTSLFENETNVEKIRYILEEELRLMDLDDYVISENTHDQSEIAILRKGDIEQLGILVCIHCSMVFESEIQRTFIKEFIISERVVKSCVFSLYLG